MPHCLKALQGVYDRLGVAFDVQLGESFYDPMLAEVVKDFEERGLARESEGATVVFVEGTKREGRHKKRAHQCGRNENRDRDPGERPTARLVGLDHVIGRPHRSLTLSTAGKGWYHQEDRWAIRVDGGPRFAGK